MPLTEIYRADNALSMRTSPLVIRGYSVRVEALGVIHIIDKDETSASIIYKQQPSLFRLNESTFTQAAANRRLSLDDPVGIRKASGANEHRGRSPPEDDTSYLELTAFERCYGSATRDRSLENDERSGLYDKTRGGAIRAPNKHGPRPEDNRIQTIRPSGDNGRGLRDTDGLPIRVGLEDHSKNCPSTSASFP
ncbi:unnamed protein product [Fusarium graminearum]|uniref:Chromosome 1, complete genome n=1 Tax=Gibberella zeae (strain ATCC MYA-4620 / CBS 123657 / FGSC 9075 / NRRL 31084 / PH-1) TaxID=229533 RepID=A0A098D274_GIBZE|nr:unnamed protein product [Fusarium graminearum]CEF73033.1 unnamed protein product [Fusarium graminearum]